MGDDDKVELLEGGLLEPIPNIDFIVQQMKKTMGIGPSVLLDPVRPPSSASSFPQIGYKELVRLAEQLEAVSPPIKPERMMVIDRGNPDPEQVCELVNWYMKNYGKNLLTEAAYTHHEITHDTDSPFAQAVSNMNLERPKTVDDAKRSEHDIQDTYLVKRWDKPAEPLDVVILEFSDPVHRLSIVQYAHIMLGKGHRDIYDDTMKKVALYEALERSKIESMAKRLTQEGT